MRHLLTVITLLLALTCCTTPGERKRMYAGLDSLNQRNRNSQPFTPADVQPYVDFFDRHGTSNDRLMAYYLMGRAYHEQGEAPMALQYYQQAADCADTTATDCDYAQLSRVHAQMANLYYQQNLIRQQIEKIEESVNYSLLSIGGDRIPNAIYRYRNKSKAPFGDKHSDLINTGNIWKELFKFNVHKDIDQWKNWF